MVDASSIPVNDPANTGKNRRRRQFSILLACVLIATALWFLRAFENEYTTRVENPVMYSNLPEQMTLLSPLPQRLSLDVKGLGFSIVRHNWNFSKTPLIIDFRKLRSGQVKRTKGFVEYLSMDDYIDDFSAQLSGLKVLAVVPDTLTFRFAITKTRKIRVIPVSDNDRNSSLIPAGLLTVTPDSIIVEGPDIMLDTLRGIQTLPVKQNRQGGSFSRTIGLEPLDKLLKYSQEKVTVSYRKNNSD